MRPKYKISSNLRGSDLLYGVVFLLGVLLFIPFRTYLGDQIDSVVQSQTTETGDVLGYATPLNSREELTGTRVITTQQRLLETSPLSARIEDPRIIAMEEFLESYDSPLTPHSRTFINEADQYGLDWRLVASISGVESAFGELIPPGSYNGWGWKGDPTQEWSHFSGWDEAIATVTRGLALGYGITLTPFDIEPTYCPPCGRNPEHAWANGVTNYMNQLEALSETYE